MNTLHPIVHDLNRFVVRGAWADLGLRVETHAPRITRPGRRHRQPAEESR